MKLCIDLHVHQISGQILVDRLNRRDGLIQHGVLLHTDDNIGEVKRRSEIVDVRHVDVHDLLSAQQGTAEIRNLDVEGVQVLDLAVERGFVADVAAADGRDGDGAVVRVDGKFIFAATDDGKVEGGAAVVLIGGRDHTHEMI